MNLSKEHKKLLSHVISSEGGGDFNVSDARINMKMTDKTEIETYANISKLNKTVLDRMRDSGVVNSEAPDSDDLELAWVSVVILIVFVCVSCRDPRITRN